MAKNKKNTTASAVKSVVNAAYNAANSALNKNNTANTNSKGTTPLQNMAVTPGTKAPTDANGNRISVEEATRARMAQQQKDLQQYQEQQQKQAEQQRQQEELQRQMQEFMNSYVPSVDYMGVYNDYANRMNNILQQQKDALNQQTVSQARSAYVANEQGKNEIPRLLANAGVTGGVAEKVRTNQNASYQQNLANILSSNATQGAELERNNANAISEAYKEAMSNQQAVDNERALAAQQYANQLALQQQQQAYEEQQARTEAANSNLNSALAGGFKDTYDSKGKFKTSAANQMSGYYNQAKANGASQATLDNFEYAMILAAQARYNNNPDKRKEKLTWEQYKQKYVGDRIGKTY